MGDSRPRAGTCASSNQGEGGPISTSLKELLTRFGASSIETWTDADWEGFTLQALWRLCCDGVRDLPPFTRRPPPPVRQREMLCEASGIDTDELVHDVMIRFCAAFLDQGMARWPLPRREEGLYRAFCALYRHPGLAPDDWMRGLARELGRLEDQGVGPLDSILESLDALGVAEEEWEAFLSATLLALRGWGGMVRQVELRADSVVLPIAEGSLNEFLAIRLLLDRFALIHTARTVLGLESPVCGFWSLARGKDDPNWPPSVEQRAFLVFQLAQVLGLSPDVVYRLSKPEWATLLREIESFTAVERRRIFHLAYERRFCAQTLDADRAARAPASRRAGIAAVPGGILPGRARRVVSPPSRGAGTGCRDVRRGGFLQRRDLLQGGGRRALHTPVPGRDSAQKLGRRGSRDRARRDESPACADPQGAGNGIAAHPRGEPRLRLGAVLAGTLGVLASFPLLARILFPRLTAHIRRTLGQLVQTPPLTRVRVERMLATPGPADGQVGFNIAEMTDAAERFLRDIGLNRGFARLMLLLGHGSNSQNNPHNSAYNCGACGGMPAAPTPEPWLNSSTTRGFAMASPREACLCRAIRSSWAAGITRAPTRSPITTWSESRSRITASSSRCADIENACDHNAHERCRRFMSAPLTLSFSAARQHVEERAEDLAQTRPELGHATNAIVVVGRREWSRGLFLDRRAFLASYDPTSDTNDHAILTRILQAAFTVCAGINLEYYFSHVDNAGFGCRHQAAPQPGVASGRHGWGGQRFAHRAAVADGRNSRARPIAVSDRDHPTGDGPDHGAQRRD